MYDFDFEFDRCGIFNYMRESEYRSVVPELTDYEIIKNSYKKPTSPISDEDILLSEFFYLGISELGGEKLIK